MLFIAFSVLFYTFYCIFDCSFNKTRNANFCSDLNFCRCYLSIIIMFLDFSALLYLVVYAFIWIIIIQAIKRILASAKSMIANFYDFFLILFSFFVLKATISHIFVKSFVCFNTLSHLNSLHLQRTIIYKFVYRWIIIIINIMYLAVFIHILRFFCYKQY